jgi:hypothetical protein
MDSGDDFLADVAPFVEADGAGLQTGLEGDVGFVHIGSEAWDAGFEADEFESFPAASAGTRGFCGSEQFLCESGEGIGWDEKVEPGGAEARLVHDIDFAEGCVGGFGESERFGRKL